MPKYVVCINRTLVLTTSVETETPDKDVAEEAILKLEEEGKFGVIAWKVENATCDTINGWQRGADYITIERVTDVQS